MEVVVPSNQPNQLNADAVGFGADVVVAATGCGVAVTDWTGVAYCCTED